MSEKRIKAFLAILILLIPNVCVKALSLDKNDIYLNKGENEKINIYANTEEEVSSIDLTLTYTTYDMPSYYTPAEGVIDNNPNGIKHKLILSKPTSGKILLGTVNVSVVNNPTDTKGQVNINNASASNDAGKTIKLDNQDINIFLKTAYTEPAKKDVDKNMLKEIQSKIVKIELKKDIFEYNVTINKDLKELDLKPIANEENTKIAITSQKISELKDNKIIITTTNNNVSQDYTINVSTLKDIENVDIDKEEFVVKTNYKSKWVIVLVGLAIVLVFGLILAKRKK